MNLLLVADGRYIIDKENNVFVESVFEYSFYARYLLVFDNVYAIVRAQRVDKAPSNMRLASGKNVHFLILPPFYSVFQLLSRYLTIRKLMKEYVKGFDCAVFRIPGVVSNMVLPLFAKQKKPFAVELVLDPWEAFAKGTTKSLMRPIMQWWWTKSVKKWCMDAIGVSYVTKEYLQKKYPCKALLENNSKYFTGSYSSVELPDDAFGEEKEYTPQIKYIISHAANAFSTFRKGHLPLMNALKKLLDIGYDVDVWFIGDGKLRSFFENYAKDLGIADHVVFCGRFPNGESVKKVIKESDIFVFPTLAEGLPRVVLEAMSEGKPVVSSPICGIPEILQEEYLVNANDSQGFANVIKRMIDNPAEMTECSKRNLKVANEYRSSLLNKKRYEFYKKLRDYTENNSKAN